VNLLGKNGLVRPRIVAALALAIADNAGDGKAKELAERIRSAFFEPPAPEQTIRLGTELANCLGRDLMDRVLFMLETDPRNARALASAIDVAIDVRRELKPKRKNAPTN
jgi:hypothetical protein